MKDKTVHIFTDGGCRGNPGIGGWGAVLRYNHTEKDLYGYEQNTTNNRMELMAAIRALELLTRPCDIELTTDSQYVRRGITEWMDGWKKRGWKTAAKKPVKNKDLWQRLERATEKHKIKWHWIKGHSGHEGNERADQLANKAMDEKRGNTQ